MPSPLIVWEQPCSISHSTLAAVGDLNTNLNPTFAMLAVRTFTFWVVGYSVVWLMNVQRRQRQELAGANQRLALYAATLDQLATQRERNRIARELHDILAHSLSNSPFILKELTACGM